MTIAPVTTVPPSRRGKKQIVAYLDPALAEAAYARARTHRRTLQEVLGEAINAAYEATGRRPIVELGHMRLVRRKKGRARTRGGDIGTPPCRTGRRAVGGWFNESTANEVAAYAAEIGQSVQSLVEFGMRRITGVQPAPESERPAE